MPALLAMGKADPARTEGDYDIDRSRRGLSMPGGLPINKPPYGILTAIDLNKGEHAWQVPLGDTPSLRSNPALRGVALPARLGATGLPGPVVTKGGLVFVPGGSQLYAFDKSTGEELWAGDLGERGSGTPMTYATSSGRQFVVATGGESGRCRQRSRSGGRKRPGCLEEFPQSAEGLTHETCDSGCSTDRGFLPASRRSADRRRRSEGVRRGRAGRRAAWRHDHRRRSGAHDAGISSHRHRGLLPPGESASRHVRALGRAHGLLDPAARRHRVARRQHLPGGRRDADRESPGDHHGVWRIADARGLEAEQHPQLRGRVPEAGPRSGAAQLERLSRSDARRHRAALRRQQRPHGLLRSRH
ncbi:MAG: PQQ-binding-like beta-propeller repeat protein [Acidobacteria bacterium]|nr:PQQ-binding-like beta-propeller repeat protein [Acidobacteriota bacterium]